MKQDRKPVYAEHNPDWRVVHMANGLWRLQERVNVPEDWDRRSWVDHNGNMAFDDALIILGSHNLMPKAA